jgi:hypothetical protein
MAICCAAFGSGCSPTGNDEHAYFVKQGPRYLVEMKGRRRLLAHDPISAVLGRTYEETVTLQLPRIDGPIDGAEIPVAPDKLRYIGRVVIANGRMKVDLSYNDDSKAATPWNGEYVLVQRGPAGVQ